jgi:2-hydroxychromene-2-carboxylate isomerase
VHAPRAEDDHGCAGRRHGALLVAAREVSRLVWDGTVDGWDRGDHLAQAARRAGLELGDLQADADGDPEGLAAVIAANQFAHERSGHWGVPTFVFEGEPFFGQDRIELLLWRLRQRGLRPRGQEVHAGEKCMD